MRKLALSIIAILLIGTICIYVLIPSQIEIIAATSIKCPANKLNDCLHNSNTWKSWWPAESHTNGNNTVYFKDYSYSLAEPYTNGAAIRLTKNKKTYPTKLLLIPQGFDSTVVQWKVSLKTSPNPIIKMLEYFEAFDIKNKLDAILNNLRNFAGNTKNVYGFPIERTTFTDTILIATRFESSAYPSISTIYGAIQNLKSQIAAAGAKEKDYPMFNVIKKDSTHFETMIAICIDKAIRTVPPYFISRMVPMKDRFLKTGVTGGPLTIKKAHEAIDEYMKDHILSQPAIPFEILVTDRNKETDTSKWKTTIFYPSM
jgi:hypothetical protein